MACAFIKYMCFFTAQLNIIQTMKHLGFLRIRVGLSRLLEWGYTLLF